MKHTLTGSVHVLVRVVIRTGSKKPSILIIYFLQHLQEVGGVLSGEAERGHDSDHVLVLTLPSKKNLPLSHLVKQPTCQLGGRLSAHLVLNQVHPKHEPHAVDLADKGSSCLYSFKTFLQVHSNILHV